MNTSSVAYGKLYIVATPIGNLEDISARAIRILSTVDTILAEDTRHSAHLLQSLNINKPLLSLHDHNEIHKSDSLIEKLKQGESFALISDAGTPLISDPGFVLVKKARLQQITVIPIPGASACITALSAAGIPCDTFTFIGFLPAKRQARTEKLKELSQSAHTNICYESTHRIRDCIETIIEVYGSAYYFVLAKEMTKTFEHFVYDSGEVIKSWLNQEPGHSKGEFVLILPSVPAISEPGQDLHLLRVLLQELPVKQAVRIATQLSSSSKNELYKIALNLTQKT